MNILDYLSVAGNQLGDPTAPFGGNVVGTAFQTSMSTGNEDAAKATANVDAEILV